MKVKSLLLVVLLLPALGSAQRRPEKPRVHADFHFGSLPASRELSEIMAKENARLVAVGYHSNWAVDKIAKELKLDEDELRRTADDLEDQRLAGQRSEFEVRPFMPVLRERDLDRLVAPLQRHTNDFLAAVEASFPDIEKFVATLPGSAGPAKDRMMYETVVSGILLGGVVDALNEDKTMVPPGPSRLERGVRAYAWLVESNSQMAGRLKRETRESEDYQIVSIGAAFSPSRPSVTELRGLGSTVLDEADARRFRTFIALLCRDKFLPLLKAKRSEFIQVAAIPESAKYVAAAEFIAWYYNSIANGVVDRLVASGRLKPPADVYTYAIRNPVQ